MAEIRATPPTILKRAVNGMPPIGALRTGNRRFVLETGNRRFVLETDDGAAIGITYRGTRHGPAGAMAKVDACVFADPSLYHVRTAVCFETAAP